MRLQRFLFKRSGVLTVEAAVIFPFFVMVILSLIFFLKILYVHEVIQHAISETADEISVYSYLYSVSGLQGKHDELSDKLNEGEKTAKDHLNTINNVYGSFSELIGKAETVGNDIKGIDINQFSETDIEKAQKIADQINEIIELSKKNNEELKKLETILKEIKNDPKEELISLLCLLGNSEFSSLKRDFVLVPLTKLCMAKYLITEKYPDVDERLKSLNIVDGINGIDFESSTFLNNKKDIDIVVRYKVKLLSPIGIIPEFNMVQRATVRAWLNGDSDSLDSSNVNDNLWEIDPRERGMLIKQKCLSVSPATPTEVISFDLSSKTYVNNPSAIKSKVKGCLSDTKVKNLQRLLVVVRKGTLNETANKKIREGFLYGVRTSGDLRSVSLKIIEIEKLDEIDNLVLNK